MKLKLWWNSKTQIVIKFKNSNAEKLKHSNCDKTQKLKLWKNSQYEEKKLKNSTCDRTQIVTKLENSNYDTTQKLKLWQKSETQILTKL